MLFDNKKIYYSSLVIFIFFILFILYIIYTSFFIVKNQFLDLDDDTVYINQVRSDKYTKTLALKLTKNCTTQECEVQSILNLVTNIPYKINKSVARSGKNVLAQNYGDCDDKSNFLISLLHAKNYEAYFVLVPRHIFVIVTLKQKIKNKKAIYINGKAFYILESTAKNSKIAFPLQYQLKDIRAIIDPFKNKKLLISNLRYEL